MALLKLANLGEIANRAIVLDLGDLRRQGERLIELSRIEAGRIEREAREERRNILLGASEKGFADGMAEGLVEGIAKGRAEGLAAAIAEHRVALAALNEGWNNALIAFDESRDRLLSEGQQDVIRLATMIASRVIKRRVELDPTIVVDQIADVLKHVLRPTRLLVAVHPEDRVLVENALPQVVDACQHNVNIELVDDASLARGSCVARLADGGGRIDASIDAQLQRIVDALIPPGVTGKEGA